MKSSTVLDAESGEVYPDIMTADYAAFDFSIVPKRKKLEQSHLEKPYLIAYDEYGSFLGDDVLLDLNLIPHYLYLDIDKPFFIPNVRDLNAFMKAQTSRAKSQGRL